MSVTSLNNKDCIVRVDNVSKGYRNKKVLNEINFEIMEGQKVCLIGSNGAGQNNHIKNLGWSTSSRFGGGIVWWEIAI